VQAQADQGEVPADADGARPVLRPEVRVHGGFVHQLERGAGVGGAEGDRHPRDLATELPGDVEALRGGAPLDLAAGVALELVAPADRDVTADREEPAGQAVDGGEGVPEVGSLGGIGAAGDGDLGRGAVPAAVADLTGHEAGGGDGVDDVGHVVSFYK
jgi:hypothetical protein